MESDPIFKGCTRPAMKVGVPLVPLIILTLGSLLIGLWGMLLMQSLWVPGIVACVYFALIFTAKEVTKKDDQRFQQVYLWIVLRLRNPSKRFWGSYSYSPHSYKKRK